MGPAVGGEPHRGVVPEQRMSDAGGIDPVSYLRELAVGLGKCGIPVQLRRDAEQSPYLRASRPDAPLGTDLYCVRYDDGACYLRSEWGTMISPADDLVTAIGYVVKLLRLHSSDRPN